MSLSVRLEQRLQICSPSPLQTIQLLPDHQIWCKRDDLLHPIISGNKWRKLKPVIVKALQHGMTHIGSFGGAYSNHLHALAYICYTLGLNFTAVVRAHPHSPLTPTLSDLIKWGATLHFVSREDYKRRTEAHYCESIIAQYALDVLIPEGGSSADTLDGVASILNEVAIQQIPYFDTIVLPVASGGTMAGLVKYIYEHDLPTEVIGIAVLKGEGYLEHTVSTLLNTAIGSGDAGRVGNWQIEHNAAFHGGGYAKTTAALAQFQQQFLQTHGFAIDKVYNTKSFYALTHLLANGVIAHKERVMLLHTGGLQGERGKNE
jgi:1-aminocyclopropane-1-carboxylate deaminase